MKLNKKMCDFIDYLFITIISYTFFGALFSNTLNILNSSVLFIFFTIFAFSLFLIYRGSLHLKIANFKAFLATKKCKLFILVLFIVVFIFQLVILFNYKTGFTWDVDLVQSVSIMDKNHINKYLSENPNNSLYFFWLLFLKKTVLFFFPHLQVGWFYFQLINTIILDFSFFLLYKAAKRVFNNTIATLSLMLAAGSLALSPWILVPYTDTLSFFVTCFIIYNYSIFKTKVNLKPVTKYLYLFFLGGLIGINFLVKPSAIVYSIAIIVVYLLSLILKFKVSFTVKNILVVLVSFFLVLNIFSLFQDKQHIVTYNKESSKPVALFVMMGLTGTGGYNQADTAKILSIPTKKGKSDYAKKQIVLRLKKHGLLGYGKFLLKKHILNTQNGDFGWTKDGAVIENHTEEKGLQRLIRNYYSYNTYENNKIRFYMQLFWLITLIGLMFSFKSIYYTEATLVLKIAILGGLVYLLLFEGGRSRYLIQFLPLIYLLSGIGFYNLYSKHLQKNKN